MKKYKVIPFMLTIPADKPTPVVLKEFKLKQDCVLEEILINPFPNTDGTAGVQIMVGSEYTIPDTDVGDGFFTGEGTSYRVPVGETIESGTKIYILGKNSSAADKYMFLLLTFKYIKRDDSDGPADEVAP